ncbi:MAG TPA: CPBP family glutamic-type intramembrane protease, partial [Candidatus Wallbacteria bacterium]|nr:CPBP family glutamic-type intramembrane protease [Candidatus Wallbacteria bacterium]
FARNFKEAQNYMTPILFFFMIPPMVGALPGYDLNFNTALVPVVNLTLLFKAMLKGDYQFQYLVMTFAVNFFFSLVTLYFAAKTFSSESILFRPSEDLETLYFWRFKELKVNQETTIFFVFFIVQMISLYFLGSFFQTYFNLKFGLILTEVLLILLPSYILIKLVYGDFLAHIRFKMVPLAEFGYAALVGLSGFGFTFVLTILLGFIIPPPEDFLKGMQEFVIAAGAYDFFVIAVLSAVLPGVCEEVMFRGALLRPLYKKYGRVTSAVYCGLLFGVFHLSLYRFLPTAFIGFYLSLITMHTGSIIPAMFCHFLNNFMIVALSNAGKIFKNYNSTVAEVVLLVLVFLAFLVFPFVIRPMLEEKREAGPIQKP